MIIIITTTTPKKKKRMKKLRERKSRVVVTADIHKKKTLKQLQFIHFYRSVLHQNSCTLSMYIYIYISTIERVC